MMTIRTCSALSLALILLLGAGCAVRSSGGDGPGPGPALVKRSQMLMGTVVFVTAVAPDEATAQAAAAAGLAEIRRLEELWSTWIPSSEISQVNANAGQKRVAVSAETYDLIRLSLEVGRLTKGSFNVAIGPAVKAWGFPAEPHIPSARDLQAVRPLVDLSAVRMDPLSRTIFLERRGMKLDVGGIGKGYAADLAAAVVKRAGATAAVVALSGDIKTFGRLPGGERFLFGIQHPRREGAVVATLELENEAVSTAGDYQRYFLEEGVLYHHILDPLTLQPARACRSVTVVAEHGVMADGLDTGIFVMGPELGMELVERLPDVEAVIVDDTGTVRVSSGLRGRVRLVADTEGAQKP